LHGITRVTKAHADKDFRLIEEAFDLPSLTKK